MLLWLFILICTNSVLAEVLMFGEFNAIPPMQAGGDYDITWRLEQQTVRHLPRIGTLE